MLWCVNLSGFHCLQQKMVENANTIVDHSDIFEIYLQNI